MLHWAGGGGAVGAAQDIRPAWRRSSHNQQVRSDVDTAASTNFTQKNGFGVSFSLTSKTLFKLFLFLMLTFYIFGTL